MNLNDRHNFAPIMPCVHECRFVQISYAPKGEIPIFEYPAPAALPYEVLYHLPHKEAVLRTVIVGSFALPALFFLLLFKRRGIRRGVAAAFWTSTLFLALTYPFEMLSKAVCMVEESQSSAREQVLV